MIRFLLKLLILFFSLSSAQGFHGSDLCCRHKFLAPALGGAMVEKIPHTSMCPDKILVALMLPGSEAQPVLIHHVPVFSFRHLCREFVFCSHCRSSSFPRPSGQSQFMFHCLHQSLLCFGFPEPRTSVRVPVVFPVHPQSFAAQ
jgi:hypothetical protein